MIEYDRFSMQPELYNILRHCDLSFRAWRQNVRGEGDSPDGPIFLPRHRKIGTVPRRFALDCQRAIDFK